VNFSKKGSGVLLYYQFPYSDSKAGSVKYVLSEKDLITTDFGFISQRNKKALQFPFQGIVDSVVGKE